MFDGYVRDWATWTPQAAALRLPDRVVSYAQFDADIDRIGEALAGLGVGPGCGVVAVRIAEPYLHRLAWCALSRLGVPSSPADDEAAELKLVWRADPPLGEPPPGYVRLTPDWLAAALAAPHRPLPRLAPEPDALVRVMLSSGTTKQPKRVGMSWRRLEVATLTNIRVYGAVRKGLWVPLTGPDSLMGFSVTICAWALGGAAVAGIPAEALPRLMATYDEGVVVITPLVLGKVLAILPPDAAPKPGWRIQVGGSALPASLAAEARRLTPDVWTGYGATESGRITAGPAAMLADVAGAVGVVVASALVDIVDEAGARLPDGASGELRVRSTRTADGYLDDEAATSARFRDGWYHTHDLARRLPDGRVVIEGRLDDRMNLGGRKFMPAILERPALECPGVLDCAAFAAPDVAGLDQVWLAVVAAPGLDGPQLQAHLAKYQNMPPLRVAWVDEIPRNGMGKIERNLLRNALVGARD